MISKACGSIILLQFTFSTAAKHLPLLLPFLPLYACPSLVVSFSLSPPKTRWQHQEREASSTASASASASVPSAQQLVSQSQIPKSQIPSSFSSLVANMSLFPVPLFFGSQCMHFNSTRKCRSAPNACISIRHENVYTKIR
jgi:hypothetical protein